MSARTAYAAAALALALATGGGYVLGSMSPADILPVSETQATQAWEAFDAQVAPEAKDGARVALIGSTDQRITAYNIITVEHAPTGESYAFSVTR